MAYRINERNAGSWSLESGPKHRKRKLEKLLSNEDKALIRFILQNVFENLEYDKTMSEGKGHLNPDAKFTDGGRISIMITGKELNQLCGILHESNKLN